MAERRPWRAIDAKLFEFTTTSLRDLHLALMTAFEQAAVLSPALNLDAVRGALAESGWDEPLDDQRLQTALSSLVGWELLEATQDHGATYSTAEEFERRNLQWSLTPRGEAAIGGVLHTVDALRLAVGLQTAVLDAIGDGLTDLADSLAEPPAVAVNARIHIQLAQVERSLAELVKSVRAFNGHLQRLLREDGTDDEVFDDVKRRTVAYLEQYVEGVDRPQRRLVTAIDRAEAFGLAVVFDRALAGANLAPVPGQDPASDWLAERQRLWFALRSWFSPIDGSTARIAGLLGVARSAIIELLRTLERRWESRRRSTSIANDFKVLAGLFADAPGDDEAHRLFSAAFGLWPARHAHLAAPDGEARRPTAPWSATPPVDVAPALRTAGDLRPRGRISRVGDPSTVRAARQRAQAVELAAHADLRQALVTGGFVRLSSFGDLDLRQFAELLSLLGTGLDAERGSDGTRRALSADGRVEIVLRDPADGAVARLRTAEGTMRGPDLMVSIALDASDLTPIAAAADA